MSSLLRPTTNKDEEQIIEFLTGVFSVGRDMPFVDPPLLRWKYWAPRADTADEARALVSERDGRIVAHAGLWPITLRLGETSLRGVQLIDWASDPQTPGAGVTLLQRATKTYDFVFSIGGTQQTQSILPRFGFRTLGNTLTFARPIRPWGQMLRHQSRNAKLPLRLIRNLWWSSAPARGPMQGWSAVEAPFNEDFGIEASRHERNTQFFQYLQQCPSARIMGFHILGEGKRQGCFVLSIVKHQARLAGAWLVDSQPESWRIALQLAQDAALKNSSASELIARTISEAGALGATQAGMRVRMKSPVFLFYKGNPAGSLPLQYQLVDDDSVFLPETDAGFLT